MRQCGTRNADRIARELGLIVMSRDFSPSKKAHTWSLNETAISLSIKHLDPVMHDIVLLHEIGHDCLHRREAIQVGGLQEFNIFDMRDKRMEYEANMFAAQIALPDEEILEYIYGGYDVGQIARAMCSDINLVALKVSELNTRGYRFREQEHRSDFLK